MSNLLSKETSPYLLQHANNPVEWYPWSEEALTLSREQDKPILLSIGYSACHWCHVMAHESFENTATAALMNEHFINIKVDREERPDLDQIYQSAHALMAQRSGGWPLTMFLTPDQVPFYGGTYFPPTPRYGLPGFADLLHRVAEAYSEHKTEILSQRESFIASLSQQSLPPQMPVATSIQNGLKTLTAAFDSQHGGFGNAPKFPNAPDWTLLLRAATQGDKTAWHMAQLTLSRMAAGGIYDHIGGGFCRYSVDERWEIPHFEKMLYDNGQLLCLYADAWLLSGENRWREVTEETISWLLREMQHEGSAFYAALDADAEGKEGKYYVWHRDELAALLSPEEFPAFARYYGLDDAPNFEGTHWHLCVKQEGTDTSDFRDARARLLQARENRIRPGRDEKILTSWNALAIKGLARAGRVFGRTDWVTIAQNAADFVRDQLWVNGRLLACYKDGQVRFNAYLDDHTFLLDALMELLQTDYRQQDLRFAIDLAEALLARFEDKAEGGFFFTSHDHERLIHRPKSPHDNAIPSGNGVAAFALQRLGHLLGETRYLRAAENTLQAFGAHLDANPAACPTLLCALQESLVPPTIVILRGDHAKLTGWKELLSSMPLPNHMLIALPAELESGFPTLDKFVGDSVNAYVCRGVECLPVINDLDNLVAIL
jgi:uncharacterized protein YyaL (SSP411 family)